MPNPRMPHPPSIQRFPIADGWRAVVCFVNGDGYTAQLEHQQDQQWVATGPIVRSRRSAPYALARLAFGYRGLAELIDPGLSLRPGESITLGCTRCGYSHIEYSETDRGIRWRCAACSAAGGVPLPGRRSPDTQHGAI